MKPGKATELATFPASDPTHHTKNKTLPPFHGFWSHPPWPHGLSYPMVPKVTCLPFTKASQTPAPHQPTWQTSNTLPFSVPLPCFLFFTGSYQHLAWPTITSLLSPSQARQLQHEPGLSWTLLHAPHLHVQKIATDVYWKLAVHQAQFWAFCGE